MARQFLIGTPFGALGVDDGEDGREYIGVGIGIDEGTAAPTGPIAFRSLTSTTYAIRTNTVLTAPAGLADGDILITAIVVGRNAVDIDTFDPVPPAGWAAFGTATKIGDASTFTGKLHLWWKRASSESGSYTFTHNSVNTQGLIKAYSGCLASGTPLGATANATGSGTTSTGTSITTTAANSYLLYEAHNWTGTARLPASGMTERFDNLLYSADELIASASSTGTRVQNPNGNSGGGDVWAVRMVELLAYTGAPPPEATGTLTATLGDATLAATGTVLVQGGLGGAGGAPTTLVSTFTPGYDRQDFDGRVGFKFTPSTNLTFNRIGLWRAHASNVSPGTVDYGLWGGGNITPLGSASVTPAGPVDAFDYATVADFTLTAGVEYYVALMAVNGGNWWAEQGPVTVPGATGINAIYVVGSATTGGAVADADRMYAGVDLAFVPAGGYALGNATLAAAGTVFTPSAGTITGTLSVTLGAATASASGKVVIRGSVTRTLDAATLIASGAVTDSPVELGEDVLETEGGDWRETESGVVRIIDRTSVGALAVTLAPASFTATGKVVVRGATTATLGAATLSAAGKVLVAGTLTATLGAATTSTTGGVVVRGALTATLGSATLSATGRVPVIGQLPTTTLANATVAATGTVNDGLSPPTAESVRETEGGDWRVTENDAFFRIIDITSVGILTTTLDNATLGAAGKVLVRGTLTATLDAATLSATGTAANNVFSGSLTATLAPATLTAAGVIGAPIPPPFYDGSRETEDDNWRETEDGNIRIIDVISVGVLAITLDNATLSATGKVTISGSAALTAAAATLVATGTVTPGATAPDRDGVRETEGGDWRETEDGTVRIVDRITVGTLALTLAPATLSATGTVSEGEPLLEPDGVRQTEQGDWRETEDGSIRIIDRTAVGVLSATLGPATLSASGTVSESPPSFEPDGIRETEGGDFRETEDGKIRIIDRTTVGALSVTLAPATLSASGTVGGAALPPIDGSRETEAGDWRQTENGVVRIIEGVVVPGGRLHVTLAPATLAATGTVLVRGTAAITLQPATLAATGTSGGVVPDTGLIDVWTGSAWVKRPAKVWTGSEWVRKLVKHWNGSEWVD